MNEFQQQILQKIEQIASKLQNYKINNQELINEKQELKACEKATYVMTFYLDPEMVNDPTVKNLHDVTMSYTFFSTDYYKQS